MIKDLCENIVFVTGAKRSAIYDLNAEKVYSINDEGSKIICDLIENRELTEEESVYVDQIKELFNIKKFEICDHKFEIEQPRIKMAWLEITQKCNCKCLHCYEGCEHFEIDNPLALNDWYKIVDDLSTIGCDGVQLLGGEPTLYSNLVDLLKYCITKNFKQVTIYTNLMFLSDEVFKIIKDNNVIVNTTFYGSNSEIHDKITQIPGSFSRLVKNLKKLKDADVKTRISVLIMKENEGDYENIINMLKSLGITNYHYDEIRKVYLGEQCKHLPKKRRLQLTSPNFKINKKIFNMSNKNNTCWYGKIVVSTNGDVFPCVFERNIKYGNVKNNSLIDIFNGELTKKYWSYSFENIEMCKDCEYRYACKDCRPVAFAENGNINEKNPYCSYNPKTGIWEK